MNFVKCIPAVLVLFTLLFPPLTPSVKADSFTHDFGAGSPAVTFTGNTQCTTSDGYTYLCGEKAEFGLVSSICLKLYNTGDYVTLSPATKDLTEVYIYTTSSAVGFTSVKVYLSNDGSSWWGPVPEANMTYNKLGIIARFGKSAYYVKIVNTDGTNKVTIRSIQYTTTDCNCFIYTPE